MTRDSRLLTIGFCVLACGILAARQAARDAPAQPAVGTASLAGVVVTDDGTPQPARKARVTLNSVDRNMPGRTTTTDDAGRFAFRDLPAGRFNLAASKPAYLTANYGAKRAERPGTPISLAKGQQIASLVMKIARGSAISGLVRDQSGQPMPGAAVSALRYGYSVLTGERTLGQPSTGASGVTDDRGVYRMWGLPPGDYILMVTPGGIRSFPPGFEDIRRLTPAEIQRAVQLATPGRGTGTFVDPAAQPLPPSAIGSTANYAPMFFPGTADLSGATMLTLAAAEDRGGVDFQIQLIPTARISGTVSLPEGVTLRSLSIALTPAGSQAQTLGLGGRPSASAARIDSDKAFSIAGVTPGQYTLLVKTNTGGGRGGPPASASAPIWWGMTDVTVDGRDVSVSVELRPGLTVSGHLAFEGMSPPTSVGAMRFLLVPPGSGGNLSAGPAGGDVNPDGRFAFTGVTPGTYRLTRLGSIGGSWALKSALADGRDVLDAPLEIAASGGVKDLVVAYTDRPTGLTGILQDASGRAASDYFIIVFPTDKSYWTPGSRRVVETRPSNDGRYTVGGLPPGDYRVAALTDVEAGEWNDPSFLAGLVDGSIRVTLVEGQKTTQDLKLVGGRVE